MQQSKKRTDGGTLIRHSKKANAAVDLMVGFLAIFIFIIVTIFVYKIFDNLNTNIQADTGFDTATKVQLQNTYNKFPSWADGIFVFALGMIWVGLIISSFYISTHPIFFVISIVLVTIVFIVGMLLSNTYEDIANSDDLSAYSENLPTTNWIMGHLLEIMIAMGATVLIALYAKR